MYREVTMIEITEVLRLWRDGVPKKRIAARLGLGPKTVRRYITTAETTGLPCDGGAITDAQVRDVLLALHPAGGRPRGDGWSRCRAQQAAIQQWLQQGIRLTKIRKLLARQGVTLTYATLHRVGTIASRWSSSISAERRPRSRSSMARRARSCRSTPAGSDG